MKKSRFTDSQIIDALKRAEASLTVPELWRELGISSATFYKWRTKFGMDASLMARMKELEEQNRRLRNFSERWYSGGLPYEFGSGIQCEEASDRRWV